ncbi:MAG: hypothetical protein EOP81_01675 [Variovorax sp.]|nr:MAG: hypothetical protein EOP81_01675 [Variovorax sp.]
MLFESDGVVVASGTLDAHRSAADFAEMLPLELAFDDYASTEKIAVLPRALMIEDAPTAYTPVAGDICFYAPWGNLAVFYEDGEHSVGLVRLGRLESGMDVFKRTGMQRLMLLREGPAAGPD